MIELDDTGRKLKPSEKIHYVSNKLLLEAYVEWYKEIAICKLKGVEEPQIPKFIAESIMKICTRLAFRPNFISYSYRDDMIADALENCIRTVKNFNPERSINPFSFITTIAFNAFLRRIKTEKNQSYIKGKLIAELPIEDLICSQEHDEDAIQIQSNYIEYLRENNFVAHLDDKKSKIKHVIESDDSLEVFMVEDHVE
jgi:hypothetical protein